MNKENKEFLTVNEVAELLNINEKKIYALLKDGRIPGTKITGKWLFPKEELEEFIRSDSRMMIRRPEPSRAHERNIILAAGSDDPAMSTIQGVFHRTYPHYVLFSSIVGSEEGLHLLNEGFCSIAFCHLYDTGTKDFNFAYMERLLDDPGRYVVVNLFYRTVGFVTKKTEVGSFSDIVAGGLAFINRQKGSGIRSRVDAMVEKEHIRKEEIRGFDEEAYTHLDVITHILSGKADVGVTAQSVACLPGLCFKKILQERFDMVVLKDSFFGENIQAFVEFVRSDNFKRIMATMQGYDCRNTGKVMYPNQIS